ncbi:phosphoglucomutase/phosphomannomutase family protein [Trichlorobacter ammonificans]|uniref:Phosphomannomutase n=1 Tax=Trichlorobacter ammonificans TaxID=2916410 RepID=A0ABN8HIQ7_9BACT|nr:phosphoglucomutase/phosphomannomutase family protein [Trichlorobacter ammonificans]CAH2032658.1 Phosphomannomutase [Trichlorobacter ammonificans]
MQIKFGTDGWRGVIARDFTFDNLSLVAQATMDWLHRAGLADKGLVVGYDRRFLSPEFARRVAEIAAGNDIRVLLTESYAPTPAVSWAVKEQGSGAGIMMTASHNPPIYNGFKVKEQYGGSARPTTTALLEQIVAYNREHGRPVHAIPFERAVREERVALFDATTGYLRQLARCVDLEKIRAAAIPAVVDPMYGAGSGFLARLLTIDEIHGDENPGFGGQPPEPIGEHLEELSRLVASGRYRVGLALDGDADRIGAVDERGAFFSSHAIFTLLLKHLVERKGLSGGVVKTVSSTRMIDLLAERYGLPLYETPIGFKHICELMLERPILMGGEESGGLGVTGHIPERDGILMGLLLLETVAVTGQGLGEQLGAVMADIGQFRYRRIDLTIEQEAKARLLERLRSEPPTHFAGRSVTGTNFSDGFKFLFDNGDWLLIRPSGTEPVLRLYSEAGDEAMVEQLLRAARQVANV